jgi:hypothetical protein
MQPHAAPFANQRTWTASVKALYSDLHRHAYPSQIWRLGNYVLGEGKVHVEAGIGKSCIPKSGTAVQGGWTGVRVGTNPAQHMLRE